MQVFIFSMRIASILLNRAFYASLILVSMVLNVSAQVAEDEEPEERHHCLYEEKSISIGAGASYSLPLDLVGINVRSYYNLNEKICLGPEFSFFKSPDVQVLEFNAIAHYVIETPVVGISPIAGLNYTSEELVNETEEGFGVAFGLGVHRNFDKMTLFTEYISVVGAVPDNFINVGVFFSFEL